MQLATIKLDLENVDANVEDDDGEEDGVKESSLPQVAAWNGQGQQNHEGRQEQPKGPENAGSHAATRETLYRT